MSMSHPLLAVVCRAMESIAPLALADSSWDNVGVLIEAPIAPTAHRSRKTVFLTIDLTPETLDEAIAADTAVIVAYHPVIFSGLKKLSLSVPTQATVLRTISNGISVYCPHTSLDAAAGGMADWLIGLLGTGQFAPIDPRLPNGKRPGSASDGQSCRTGYGRVGTLDVALSVTEALEKLKHGCGISTVRVALPPAYNTIHEAQPIKTVAVCPGSGASVFRGIINKSSTVDLLLTGELSHHDVLAAIQSGSIVMLCEHTNTERGYIRDVLSRELERQLGGEARIVVSTRDKDPLVAN